MKIVGGIVLAIVLTFVIVVVLGALFTSPMTPQERAIADLRACERRVSIPSPLDPTYQDVQRAHYPAYVACMVNLGYTSHTMP